MTKPEWGAKRVCPNCGSRYYDMRRDPITCPKCGAPYDAESLVKAKKSRAAAVPLEVGDGETVREADLEADLAAEPSADAATEPTLPPAAGAPLEADDVDEGVEGDDKKDDEEEEEVMEDASELGEDEDDMAEVIENVDEEDDR